MRKKLVTINGIMGVGKTTICKALYKKVNNSVWLDGDWCWMMNPFEATEYNKQMVIKNIGYLLRNFLQNPAYEYVIFDWVIHIEDIYMMVLAELENFEFDLYKITLTCNENELKRRIQKDVLNGERTQDSIEKALRELKCIIA